MTKSFIQKNLAPNYDSPIETKTKVFDHVYKDFSGTQSKKSLFAKTKVFRYATFALLFLVGFGTRFSIDNQINNTDTIVYAQELNQLLEDSESDLVQLFAMIDEEDSLQF